MTEDSCTSGTGRVGRLAERHAGLGHAVHLGQEVVHERVVGCEELPEVQVIPYEMAEQAQGLLSHAAGDFRTVVAETVAVLHRREQAVEAHPLGEELIHRWPRPPIRQKATCLGHHLLVRSKHARSRCSPQLGVWRCVPQCVRQSRGCLELLVGAVGAFWRNEQEVRRLQHGLDSGCGSLEEVVGLRCPPQEQFRVHLLLFGLQRASEGMRTEGRDERRCTLAVLRTARLAWDDPILVPAAKRVPGKLLPCQCVGLGQARRYRLRGRLIGEAMDKVLGREASRRSGPVT